MRYFLLSLCLAAFGITSSCASNDTPAAHQQTIPNQPFVDEARIHPSMRQAAKTADVICLCSVEEEDQGKVTRYRLLEVWRWNSAAKPLQRGVAIVTEEGQPRPLDTATPEQALLFIHMNWETGQIGPYVIFSAYHGVFPANDLPINEVRNAIKDTRKDDDVSAGH